MNKYTVINNSTTEDDTHTIKYEFTTYNDAKVFYDKLANSLESDWLTKESIQLVNEGKLLEEIVCD
jgi:hypothetical protein